MSICLLIQYTGTLTIWYCISVKRKNVEVSVSVNCFHMFFVWTKQFSLTFYLKMYECCISIWFRVKSIEIAIKLLIQVFPAFCQYSDPYLFSKNWSGIHRQSIILSFGTKTPEIWKKNSHWVLYRFQMKQKNKDGYKK